MKDYSKEKGVYEKYIVFRKTSEDTWWPGHIVPIIQIYNWIGDNIPDIAKISKFNLLPAFSYPHFPEKKIKYEVKLISEAEKNIPAKNLTFLGNLPGEDLIPFHEHNNWSSYGAVGWETSKYNNRIEHYVIDMYLTWK